MPLFERYDEFLEGELIEVTDHTGLANFVGPGSVGTVIGKTHDMRYIVSFLMEDVSLITDPPNIPKFTQKIHPSRMKLHRQFVKYTDEEVI